MKFFEVFVCIEVLERLFAAQKSLLKIKFREASSKQQYTSTKTNGLTGAVVPTEVSIGSLWTVSANSHQFG